MISLVTATYGRVKEIDILLQSLKSQTFKDFELIIVDQNEHEIVKDVVNKYIYDINIHYIKSSIKGLSYNRNIGLKHAKGDIIGFPDDDCYYDNSLLSEVVKSFKDFNPKVVLVPVHNITNNRLFITSSTQKISRGNIIKKAISFNFFIKQPENNYFDERLGVGARFGSGEETDYLWNNMVHDDYGLFVTSTFVHHPMGRMDNYVKAYNYGLGFGAIYHKEIFTRKNWGFTLQYIYYLIRNIVGVLIKSNKRFYIYGLYGKIKGFFTF